LFGYVPSLVEINFLDTNARNPGPAVLGHGPVVLPDQRKKVRDAVEGAGVVSFRDDPALPFVKNPSR
jgi:hypothetical protein